MIVPLLKAVELKIAIYREAEEAIAPTGASRNVLSYNIVGIGSFIVGGFLRRYITYRQRLPLNPRIK